MIRKEEGFTLIELLITMVVFVFVMAAASQIFTGLLTQFKQQSKIAETNIEGIVGLEMLRQDLEHVGYGIPWIVPAAVSNFNEGGSVAYKDCSAGPPCNPPRAVVSDNGTSFNGSDYIVIKSVNVTMTDTSQKWTTLKNLPACDVTPGSENPRQWVPQNETLSTGDNVIVIAPGSTDVNARRLVLDATNSFNTTYGNVCSSPWPPTDNVETRLVYGINSVNDLVPQRPFNRADYFIATGNNIVPSRCAQPNTGVLVKAVMKQDSGGTFDTYLPLLDCVADMQVAYALDNDENGNFEDGVGGDAYSDTITGLTAQQVRNRVKEIRVYILAHEGQRDQNYSYPSSTIEIPPTTDPAAGLGRASPGFNLATSIGDPDYKYYRWKIYTISVKPIDLR